MKSVLKNVITILVVFVIGILIAKYFLRDDEELKQARDRIAQTQAQVDSLKQVNEKIAEELKKIASSNLRLEDEKAELQKAANRATARLNRIITEINTYAGTKNDLVRNLNRILAEPLQSVSD